MKANKRRLFSFSETETEYLNDKKEEIELVSCPLKDMMCKFNLISVNKSYAQSEEYHKDKDFYMAIETLKIAFNKTTELMGYPCSRCVQLYRSNIVESLENIHGELGKMSTGIFGDKSYQTSYLKAGSVLKEFENVGLGNKFRLNESKEQFLGNYLN